MISGVRDRHHLGVIRSMLSPLRVLPVRNEDFRLAISLLESTVLAHRIGWPDCVIAATCLRLKVPIVTINAADFRPIKGVQVVQPY
jgi:predicted nucleic acid-binding protein